ncbi:MAG: hypothetical protein Q7R53_01580 [bacterium]|nr:hypothetical protein [bacterium]
MRFPIENYFNLNEKIPESCVEISKLVVKKDFRGGKRIIMMGLMKKALNLSFKNKINHWAFFMTKGLCDSFKKMGVNFVEMQTLPDTEKEIAHKSKMSGYFKQDIRPYFLDLRELIG